MLEIQLPRGNFYSCFNKTEKTLVSKLKIEKFMQRNIDWLQNAGELCKELYKECFRVFERLTFSICFFLKIIFLTSSFDTLIEVLVTELFKIQNEDFLKPG